MSNETLVRQILDEIERNPSISQRQLSDNLGGSIGIVNWHMKRKRYERLTWNSV